MATGLAGHFVAMARSNAWANHRLLRACDALAPQRVEFLVAAEEVLRRDELREPDLPEA